MGGGGGGGGEVLHDTYRMEEQLRIEKKLFNSKIYEANLTIINH